MGSLDYRSFSFQIHQSAYCETEYRFNCQDKFHGIEGESDLIIKNPPSFLEDILEDPEKLILVCHNITINNKDFRSILFDDYFAWFISKGLAELYLFCLSCHFPGILILLPETEIKSFTESQRRGLRKFIDLFSFVQMSSKGVYRLYMPTDFESFQRYCELHIFLEQQLSGIKSDGENI